MDIYISSNYRPTASDSNLSNIWVMFVQFFRYSFRINDNQFGFKQKFLLVYTVKLIIQYYTYYNSPLYSCFLDATKAFDRLNHWTLFKQLILRDAPIIVIQMLCFWYRSRPLCTQSGKTKSTNFTNSNGVWQGGFYLPNYFLLVWTNSQCY